MSELEEFIEKMLHHIDVLENINGKLDYEPGYEEGYKDACVAIKNTLLYKREKIYGEERSDVE